MPANEAQQTPESEGPSRQSVTRRERTRASKRVTQARALAQRAKLDAQAEARQEPVTQAGSSKQRSGKHTQRGLQANRRAHTTVARAIEDYLLDHEGGNHSAKTLEWHRTALGLMRAYFEEDRGITLVGEIEACAGYMSHPLKESLLDSDSDTLQTPFVPMDIPCHLDKGTSTSCILFVAEMTRKRIAE